MTFLQKRDVPSFSTPYFSTAFRPDSFRPGSLDLRSRADRRRPALSRRSFRHAIRFSGVARVYSFNASANPASWPVRERGSGVQTIPDIQPGGALGSIGGRG